MAQCNATAQYSLPSVRCPLHSTSQLGRRTVYCTFGNTFIVVRGSVIVSRLGGGCSISVVKYRHMIGTKGVSYLYIGPLFNYVCSFVCVFYMCNYSIIFS